jgi:hypothetical protein
METPRTPATLLSSISSGDREVEADRRTGERTQLRRSRHEDELPDLLRRDEARFVLPRVFVAQGFEIALGIAAAANRLGLNDEAILIRCSPLRERL